MAFFENRAPLRQAVGLVVLVVLLCVVIIYQFTHRLPEDIERKRAQVILRRIYDLEMAYHAEHGTYLAIDRKNNGDVLRLDQVPGRFEYRVVISGNGFTAYADADLNGDGQVEMWQVDRTNTEPILVQED